MRRFAERLIPIMVCCVLLAAGCGGGGGGGSAAGGAPPAVSPTNYATRQLTSGSLGPAGGTLSGAGVTLTASLPATQTLTITERVYPNGPPANVVGRVVDIAPDGTQFPNGATLCLSYAGYPGSVTDLDLYTGGALDQPLRAAADTARRMLCATLPHASPYAIERVRDLTLPAMSLFGNMDKATNTYTVQTSTETDSTRGALQVYDILVHCDLRCIESGRRVFKFATGGTYKDDLFINEKEGAYPLWSDFGQMFWTRLYNNSGGLTGGIAYYLAAQFVKYYTGGGAMDGYLAALDPPVNRVSRFFYLHDKQPTQTDLFVDLLRDETASPGILTMNVRDAYGRDWTYTVTVATRAITRTSRFAGGPAPVTAAPDAAAYANLNDETLFNLYMLLGLGDTPDETDTFSDSYDKYFRMTPNQELFAVNTMNTLRGYGWNNNVAIEAYYRSRLVCLTQDCRTNEYR